MSVSYKIHDRDGSFAFLGMHPVRGRKPRIKVYLMDLHPSIYSYVVDNRKVAITRYRMSLKLSIVAVAIWSYKCLGRCLRYICSDTPVEGTV